MWLAELQSGCLLCSPKSVTQNGHVTKSKAKNWKIFTRITNIRQSVTVTSLEDATARCQALFLYTFSNTKILHLFLIPNDINILKIYALYMLNIYLAMYMK